MTWRTGWPWKRLAQEQCGHHQRKTHHQISTWQPSCWWVEVEIGKWSSITEVDRLPLMTDQRQIDLCNDWKRFNETSPSLTDVLAPFHCQRSISILLRNLKPIGVPCLYSTVCFPLVTFVVRLITLLKNLIWIKLDCFSKKKKLTVELFDKLKTRIRKITN